MFPATTETEELFTLANLATYKMVGRSNVAEYDEYTRKLLQPWFEKESERLRNDPKFQKSTMTEKRETIKRQN